MRSTAVVMAAGLLASGCQGRQAAPTPAPASPAATAAALPIAPPTVTPPAAFATPSPMLGATPAGVTGITGSSLATQDTNWPGVSADVTEFRRRGNTLTLRMRLRNRGTDTREADIHWGSAYVMDAAGGKKYEVLKDEKNTYISILNPGLSNRWYMNLSPGQDVIIWAKFPAPPPEVKTVTLQVPGMPPFDDLAIQDS